MMIDIQIVSYEPEYYDQVIRMFKNGTYEHISQGVQNGWRKPKVQLFMGTSVLVLPYSVKCAFIWFVATWCIHIVSIAFSYIAYVTYECCIRILKLMRIYRFEFFQLSHEIRYARQGTQVLDNTSK